MSPFGGLLFNNLVTGAKQNMVGVKKVPQRNESNQ